ncbi:hypothetical protein M0805_006122 [Coniferiporia weirii]|nr:hypothetical protein M0805_006122 [Coniferiporia weirii]
MAPETFSGALDCALCFSSLIMTSFETDDPSTSTFPDDVELPCWQNINGSGHHFHWACLQEHDESGEWNRRKCPFTACGRDLLDDTGRLLVTVRNEGGVTNDFDISKAFDEDKESLTRKHELAMLDAVHSGEWDIVENFLVEGVDPNSVENEENRLTGLHFAAYLGDQGIDAVKLFLKYVLQSFDT